MCNYVMVRNFTLMDVSTAPLWDLFSTSIPTTSRPWYDQKYRQCPECAAEGKSYSLRKAIEEFWVGVDLLTDIFHSTVPSEIKEE